MKALYVQKNKESGERTNAFCTFLVELVSAAVGGGKSSDEGVGLDSGDGLDEMSDEQLQKLKDTLGARDFATMYPDYV